MGSDLTTLGDYIKVQGGFAFKSKDFSEIGKNKVLKIKNVRFGNIDYSDCAFVSDEVAQAARAWTTNEGDILISMTGSGPNAPQSLVGRVARVWKGEPKSLINQRVGRIQSKNESLIHSDFIFYLLSMPQSQEFLVANSSGSANQANISGKIIELLPCPQISFERSKKIADIARSLDEKIILNKKTNQTLEQMAQALFKSWFVDFDPVIDNALAAGNPIPDALQARAEMRQRVIAERTTNPKLKPLPDDIQQLFPSEFEESELGWIPKGWAVKPLNGLLEIKYGKDHKKLNAGSIPVYGSGGVMRLADKFLYVGESVLIPRKGTLSNIIYVNKRFWTVDTMFYSVPRLSNVAKFVFYHLKTLDFTAMNVGSAVPSMTTKVLNILPLVLPTDELLKTFDGILTLQFNKKDTLDKQSKSLQRIRDLLLPKLISGEITLNKDVA